MWIKRNDFPSKQKQVRKRIIQNTFSNHFSQCVSIAQWETKSSSRSSTQFDMKSFTYSTASSVLKVFNQSWKWIKEWRINGFGFDKQDESRAKLNERKRYMEFMKSDRENACHCLCVCVLLKPHNALLFAATMRAHYTWCSLYAHWTINWYVKHDKHFVIHIIKLCVCSI